ncbi:hypothetical protein DID88_000680 [Monilinia fructigena]|uniref:Uncharacterized protein n=1 Tax=Monilinia fructigena TaxID=38457 RepID=A0A395IJI2_9HELO|nr:hypothetical protein DID88_000680 [Monilinia fructigena]
MRLSNILALLLAPIALAYPIASPDSISINQRDVSAPIQARHQALSSRITKVVDESQELTDMCKKYDGGMIQSLDLYRKFKKCLKSVEHAEQGAKESKPFDESESAKVKESLEKLTDLFVQISKYIQDRKEMISGSRYKNYIVKELEKLRGRVNSFYDSCESKATSSCKPDIKGYGKKVDSEFGTVKSEILGKSKTRRSLWSRSDEEQFEGPVERFHFPHYQIPGSFNPRSTEEKSEETEERFQFSGLPDFPGFPSAGKRSLEAKSEGEETEERFHFPGLPDFPGFPSAGKKSLEAKSEGEETEERFHFPGLPDFPDIPTKKRSIEVRSEGEETEEPVERFHLPWAKRNDEFFKMLPALFKAFLSSDNEHGDSEGCQNGCETGQNGYGNGQYEHESGQNDYQNEENEFGNGQYEYENGQNGQKTSCQNKSQVKNFLQSLMDKVMRIGDAKESIGMNQSEEK